MSEIGVKMYGGAPIPRGVINNESTILYMSKYNVKF